MRTRKSTGIISRRFFVAGIFSLVLGACGGGGGGGGGPSGIQYTGLTSQAVIDDANAAALAGSAFVTGDAGASTNVLGAVVSGSGSTPQHSLKVAKALQDAVSKIDFTSSPSTAVGVVDSQTFFGPCGGSFSWTININETTGSFSGTLIFNAYCEQAGESISGQVSFSGQIDLNTSQLVSLAFAVTNLTVSDNGDNFVIAGTVAISFSGNTATITETFNIQDGSGKVYRIENLFVSVTDNVTEIQETLSGRFFHPDFGYVDVVTTAPFVIPAGSNFPTSGSLTITGFGGGKAVLTALNSTQFQLDIDKDGDDIFETTLVVNWADL